MALAPCRVGRVHSEYRPASVWCLSVCLSVSLFRLTISMLLTGNKRRRRKSPDEASVRFDRLSEGLTRRCHFL